MKNSVGVAHPRPFWNRRINLKDLEKETKRLRKEAKRKKEGGCDDCGTAEESDKNLTL